ncbi:MAG: hypothetical protein QOG00_435, partial [Pyrinomonadaceae bacterium]|nr:hypothetical protein [Pyrinomonadaceae bacterium]
ELLIMVCKVIERHLVEVNYPATLIIYLSE